MADSQRKTANLVSMSEPQGDGYLANSVIGIIGGGGGETIISAPAFFVTEYIPVSEGTYYYYSDLYRATGNNAKFMFYNANKEFIGYTERQPVMEEQPVYELRSFIVPANTAYMRMNIDKTSTKNCLYTSQLPSYEPYGWQHSLRKLTTATDTITTLPATIYPNDTTATVGLEGNMSQSGTPTPTTPIQPSGCGDLIKIKISEPLCGIGTYKDELNLATGVCTRRIKKLVLDGTEGWTRTQTGKYYINASTGCPTDYLKQAITTSICSHYQSQDNTASGSNEVKVGHFCFYTGGAFELYIGETTISSVADFKTYLQQQYANGTPVTVWYVLRAEKTETITVPSGLSGTEEGYLNQSGTPTPTNPIYPTANGVKQQDGTYSVYESYKIPISSNSTTTPVYLGEVETTRKIRKLVLDGTENWQNYGQVPNTYRLSISNTQSIGNPAICSHFVNSPISEITSGKFTVGSTWIYFRYEDVSDLADFKTYLQQQYAAGTPVTVWYVLATEETGIINEPLMKIGNYADSISGITIPVTAGANTLSVDTTVQPSEVTANYHGWHPVSAVHERENGAWT